MMIDAIDLETHRTASSPLVKAGPGRQAGRTKGDNNAKRQAVTDGIGRPINIFTTAKQINDYNRLRLFSMTGLW